MGPFYHGGPLSNTWHAVRYTFWSILGHPPTIYKGARSEWHQEKSRLLLSARFSSAISPTKFGRLGSVYFWEADTWQTLGF